ncbi:DUF6153 family protein [Streptomyces sp. NPDC049910]|uniref:DUF6153 family protein n=1 Tax=Streptomyces sp. NPDC049910 TaxID=3155278 RepID=UPI00341B95A4
MTRHTRSPARPAGRVLALLVLTVLAGVLGMHALAPAGSAGTPARPHDAAATAHGPSGHRQPPHAPPGHRQSSHAPSVPEAGPGCSHTDGGPHHLDHADGACAAPGAGSSYAPPALAAGLGAPPAVTTPNGTGAPAPAGRAPPDLAELQLLRI